MESIAANLRQFIRDNFLFGRELNFGDDESFLDLGIIDSTGVLELVSFIESQYQFTVDDSELVPENLDSIQRLVQFIASKSACAAATS